MKAVSYLLLQLLLPAVVFAQVELSVQSGQALQLIRDDLDKLERDLDPMHIALVEPLGALADQLVSIGQFDRAHRALDRAIQIIRINEGLYTSNQLPYQRKKVANTANSGNWDEARKQIEHLYWLYTKKTEYATPQLMEDLAFLSDLHLKGITEDSADQQSYHLRRGSTANWMALAIGQALYGETSPVLVPIIYKTVNHLYLEKVATDQAGQTSRALREVVPGSGRVRSRDYMDYAYHQLGYQLLTKIKNIYEAQEEVNPEALAMSELYMADWDALFKKNERALNSYKTAYGRLSDSVQDAELLAAFFAKPRLLPEPVFFPSVALAQLESDAETLPPGIAELGDSLVFSEWSASFPRVPTPVTLPTRSGNSSNIAIFSFHIAGAPDLSKLMRFRNPAPIGAAENLSVIETSESSEGSASALLQNVRYLRFRPKLVDGIPQQASAKLVYVPAV